MIDFDAWFLGDGDAVKFARQMWTACQDWDDVIDEGETQKANDVYQWMAFGRFKEPFFVRHGAEMQTAMLMMYLAWRDANVLEKESRASCEKAYVLRAQIYQVWVLMAHLIGGEEHSRVVGPQIWRCYDESLADLLKEFGHA